MDNTLLIIVLRNVKSKTKAKELFIRIKMQYTEKL
jgi:hypothetical protein